MQYKNINSTSIEQMHYIDYYNLKKKKNTSYNLVFTTGKEFYLNTLDTMLIDIYTFYFLRNFTFNNWKTNDLINARFFFEDLIYLTRSWSLIKGYPISGGRTHSNSKQCRKNKLLFNFRLNQFYSMFGYKKRNIYPTLIICEYTNRLWKNNWYYEWLQAYIFLLKLANKKTTYIPIDPVKLSKNFTNGYIREGNAAKLGKSKKITKVGTIGLPIFFTRWLYYDSTPIEFPYKLWISDSDRKKMGKKRKKNKKKNIK